MNRFIFILTIFGINQQALACDDPDLSKIHTSVSVQLCDVTMAAGKWVFNVCNDDLVPGCMTSKDFPAAEAGGVKSGNFAAGFSFGSVNGTLPDVGSSSFDPSLYAAKLKINGISGSVLTNCRDTAELTVYDNVTKPSVVGIDPGDTIEGYVSGTRRVGTTGPWGDDYVCNFGDNWRDDSKNAAGDTANCTQASDDCVYTDKSAKVMWTEENPGNATWNSSTPAAASWPCGAAGCTMNAGKNQITNGGGSGAYLAGANLRWWDAVYACEQLNFIGFSDWRLPSHKELLNAAIHGLGAAENSVFMSKSPRYWTSTSESSPIGRDSFVWITSGHAADYLVATKWKSDTYAFQCIRDISE